MGLDITAKSRLAHDPSVTRDDWLKNDDGSGWWVSLRDTFDRLDGKPEGYYQDTPETKEIRFRAGGYSGYNHWREQLCMLALDVRPVVVWHDQTGRFVGKPFYELINFSDCEGFIGPVTSAKLAADFEAFREKGETILGALYSKWAEAFKLAADDGFVIFH